MKKALKSAIILPALITGSLGGMVVMSAPAHAAESTIVCDRAYSAEYEKLVKIMGKDAYRIPELAKAAYENDTRITLDFKFAQEFAQWGDEAGKLAYEYYTGHCNFIDAS